MKLDLEKIKILIGNKNNKTKLIVIIGLVGILLIMLSEFLPKGSSNNSTDIKVISSNNPASLSNYKETTQKDLESIISKIEGVGRCSVMVTFDTSAESVYAYDSTSEFGDKNEKREYSYIIIKGEKGEEPILVKEIQPKVKGVIVVCEGGESSKVREDIISSISSAFSIASNKISISKMTTNKER